MSAVYDLREIPEDLRGFFVRAEIGLEPTPDDFVAELVAVFREVRRVLRDDGTLWLNLGDSYASTVKGSGGAGKSRLGPNRDLQNIGHQKFEPRRFDMQGLKPKDLIGIPWRVAFALQADGWYLRSDIIWHKPNPMPESVTDRPTSAHEHVFLLSKSARYFYNAEAVKEAAKYPGDNRALRTDTRKAVDPLCSDSGSRARTGTPTGETVNLRNVWTVATQPFSGAHFATFPPALIEPCIKAGSRPGDTVLDPFGGAGTTGLVAGRLQRSAILIELNSDYVAMAERRIAREAGMFSAVDVEPAA
jgi:DNA modification methylase